MSTLFSRIHNIEAGRVMVVTDLHGDWAMYQRYRDAFLHLRSRDQTHTLVIAGDYIHSEAPEEFDQSLAIVLDLIGLKASLGPELVVLLGNHELPHIYHIPLTKGSVIYTPRFEAHMGDHRQKVLGFFKSLPFWVRTKAGVSICHAGAFAEVYSPEAVDRLSTFSHEVLLDYATSMLRDEVREALRFRISDDLGMPYQDIARYYLSVEQSDDPRFDDYLLGMVASQHPDFALLWSALFSPNEYEYGQKAYAQHVKALLAVLSQDYAHQKVLVTGHIGCNNGYHVMANNRQLRLASGVHAHPFSEARALIFDAAVPVLNARALVPGLTRPGE